MSDQAATSGGAAGFGETLSGTPATVVWVGVYAVAIVAAEAVAAFVAPVPAATIDAVVLNALLVHYVVSGRRVFAALSLVPLLRLSSIAVAVDDALLFYVVGGAPVLIAVALAADTLELPGVLRLHEIRRRSQWHVALAAMVLGALATPLLDLDPLTADHSPATLAAAAVIVFAFAGVLEELVFRGIVQGALAPLLGASAIVVADLLFAATYLGSGSPGLAVFMASCGLFWGWWVQRTGSLAGAAIGHGLLAAGLLVVWPVLL